MLKETCISQYMNVEKCLEAIEKASQLISYFKEFSSKNKNNNLIAQFWPIEGDILTSHGALDEKPNLANSVSIGTSSVALNSLNSTILNVLQSLSAVMVTPYFKPCSQMPIGHGICGTEKQEAGQRR